MTVPNVVAMPCEILKFGTLLFISASWLAQVFSHLGYPCLRPPVSQITKVLHLLLWALVGVIWLKILVTLSLCGWVVGCCRVGVGSCSLAWLGAS